MAARVLGFEGEVLSKPTNQNEGCIGCRKSRAHAAFLEAQFGVKVKLVNPDGNDEIEIQDYNTSSKVTVKDLEEEIKKHRRN